ncbi:hypothetical protein [Halorarum halobium]|uniref:hypothetical protein n=1 Tax=Halorarum halobium TaxID=3075121 RepID=UPI0028B1AD12|nr:hypothetical protein [Halobaculum sp. XH14]
MSVEQRIPQRFIGPLGVLSLFVGLASIVMGFIFSVIGLTVFFGLNGLQGATSTDGVIVMVTGIALVGVSYLGYKGFMRFAT